MAALLIAAEAVNEAEGGGRRCQAAEVVAGHQRDLLALAISSSARETSGSP